MRFERRVLWLLSCGALLGVVFAGAATYAGHKTGLVDFGNIPAAMLAFGMLSIVLARRPTADEGNIVQTVSSSAATMSISGGLIGPVAALALSGHTPPLALVIVWGIAVGVVGCLIAVPLHAAFITRGTLPFPSGAATAEVLDKIYTGTQSAAGRVKMLAAGAGVAVVFAFARSFFGWIPELTIIPVTIGLVPATAIALGVSWSPLLAGIGYLAGARTAISLVTGSAIAWLVIGPALVAADIAQPDYYSLLNWLLWSGAGLMVGATLGGIASGLRRMRASWREATAMPEADFRTTRTHVLGLGIASIGVIVFGTSAFDVHWLIPTFGLVMSALLCASAARANGETDNTPAGPLGGFTQLLIGAAAPGGIDAPLSGGGVVTGTLMHSAMMLQNWRTGALVKTPPRVLLVAQLFGVVVGAVACGCAFLLITTAYGLGTEAMPAVAAVSWKATADLVKHGISAMPDLAPHGAALALGVGFVLSLKPIAKYAPSPAAMGMAFILPPYASLTLAIGGFVYWVIARRSPKAADETGVAIASGLIAGEAIAGLVIAALIIFGVSVGS